MRLKENRSNWNASAIIHRDNRHQLNDEEGRIINKKKDTRHWCKGRAGELHAYKTKKVTSLSWAYSGSVMIESRCTGCGKKKIEFTD